MCKPGVLRSLNGYKDRNKYLKRVVLIHRHAGLDPASSHPSQNSLWMPDQVRHDDREIQSQAESYFAKVIAEFRIIVDNKSPPTGERGASVQY